MSEQDTFGPYKVLEQLTEGPMARVCKAIHTVTGQRVLIRIIHASVSRNRGVKAMLEDLRDPQCDRRISDPGILGIVRVGVQDGTYYIVHEDFNGKFLNDFLREESPGPREGLTLAILITEAVRVLHTRRIVHGDIKPQNILVSRTRNGRLIVKLAMTDMAYTASDAMISLTGGLVGTPKYMSPEQIKGRKPTMASDVFSLGIVFYEILSGREPFAAEGPLGYLHANASVAHKPLAYAEKSVPADLGGIVDRMLAKEPGNRYHRADVVLDELERVEARLDGHSPTRPALEREGPAPMVAPAGGPWKAIAAVAMVMVLLLSAAVTFLLIDRFKQPTVAQNPKPPVDVDPNPNIKDPNPTDVKPPSIPPDTPGKGPARPDPKPEPRTKTWLDELEDGLDAAGRAVEFGDPEKALKKLADLKTRFPAVKARTRILEVEAEALYVRGAALQDQGQIDAALEDYRKIVKLHSKAPAAARAADRAAAILMKRVQLHQQRGEVADVARLLESVVADYPGSKFGADAIRELPGARMRYAEVLTASDPERAITLLRKAAATAKGAEAKTIQRKLAAALVQRAQRRLAAKDFVQCEENLAEARRRDIATLVALRKIEPELLYQKGLSATVQDDFVSAMKSFTRLEKDYPSSPWRAKSMKKLAELRKLAAAAGGEIDNAAMIWAQVEQLRDGKDMKGADALMASLVKRYPATEEGRKAAAYLSEGKILAALADWQAGRIEQGGAKLRAIVASYGHTAAAKVAERQLRSLAETPKGMVYVPKGPFILGLTVQQAQDVEQRFNVPSIFVRKWLGPQTYGKKVDVDGFYIDAYEVTNAEYKKYIDATNARPPVDPTAWKARKIVKGFEKIPVTRITLREAAAYAKWAGKRLPTEMEWEKAARGIDGRLFPWGDRWAPANAITLAMSPALRGPMPGGSAPGGKSPYGAHDMIGNVQEWTQDKFKPFGSDGSATGALEGSLYAVRGGAWGERDIFSLLCTHRIGLAAAMRDSSTGFRCAKSVE